MAGAWPSSPLLDLCSPSLAAVSAPQRVAPPAQTLRALRSSSRLSPLGELRGQPPACFKPVGPVDTPPLSFLTGCSLPFEGRVSEFAPAYQAVPPGLADRPSGDPCSPLAHLVRPVVNQWVQAVRWAWPGEERVGPSGEGATRRKGRTGGRGGEPQRRGAPGRQGRDPWSREGTWETPTGCAARKPARKGTDELSSVGSPRPPPRRRWGTGLRGSRPTQPRVRRRGPGRSPTKKKRK